MDSPASKIVGIRGATPKGIPVVDDEVVGELERLLEEAKEGKIHGLAVGAVDLHGTFLFFYAGSADSHDMVAVTSMLSHRALCRALHNVKD